MKASFLLSVGFALGIAGSALAQYAGTGWLEIAQQPGSLWRATGNPHVMEQVALSDICPPRQ